jgi:hypothetical protein
MILNLLLLKKHQFRKNLRILRSIINTMVVSTLYKENKLNLVKNYSVIILHTLIY